MKLLGEDEIQLTHDQKEGLDYMLEWNHTIKGDSTCSLAGSAGTGKTTLMDSFIKRCGIAKHHIAVSAPTHKAKAEIGRRTGLTAHTLQGLLGLKPDVELDNFDINNPQFNPLSEPKIGQYKLVIIDECSMVNKDLEEALVRQSKIFGVKLLYVGDKKQLPPINEKISTTFTNPQYKYTLTQIVRQSSTNPLMKIIQVLCDDIDNGTNNYIPLFKKEDEEFKDGEGYLITKHLPTFNNYLGKAYLSNGFANNTNYVKFLAWTNANVKVYNEWIKKTINTRPDMLNIGELLMCYKTYATQDGFTIVNNSEEYTVKEITPVHSSVIKCNTFKVKLYDSEFRTVDVVMVNKDSIEPYTTAFDAKLQYAKQYRGRAWKSFYQFKQDFLLLQDIIEEDEWGKKIMVCKKDFDYGYGLTTHKSQGSTYHNVFVNAGDILLNRDNDERKKLLYVALSRAKERAFILI